MARGSRERVPTLQRGMPSAGGLPMVSHATKIGLDDKAGDVFDGFAQNLNRISDKLNDRADIIASNEGRDAGIAQAMQGDVPLKNDATIRGQAFDEAATRTMLVRHDVEGREAAERIFQENKNSPGKLAKALEQYSEGVATSNMPESVKADFKLTWKRLSTAYNGEATRMAEARMREADRASAMEGSVARLKTIERLAMKSEDDPQAAVQLAAELKSYNDFLNQYGPTGSGAIGKDKIAEMTLAANDHAKETRVIGKMMRLPTVQEKSIYLKNFYKNFVEDDNTDFTLDQAEGLMSKMRAQINQEQALVAGAAAGVTDGIKSGKKLMESGIPIPGEQIDALTTQATAIGDAETTQSVSDLKTLNDFLSSARRETPADLQNWVNTETGRLNKAKSISTLEADRIDMAEKLLSNMNTQLTADPLSWAGRVGIAPVAPVSFAAADEAQAQASVASMQARTAAARTASAYYGREVSPLTNEEGAQLAETFQALDGNQRLILLDTMRKGFGAALPAALKPIAKDDPVLANSAGLDPSVTSQALQGAAAQKAGIKVFSDDVVLQTATSDTIGNAYGFAPATQSAVIETAKAIYTAKAVRRGKSTPADFDEDLYSQSLQEAAGGVFDAAGKRITGGIMDWLDNTKVVVPVGMREQDFENTLGKLTDQDLRLAGNGELPKDAKGREIKAEDLTQFQPYLMNVGDGIYRMGFSNPEKGDPGFFLGGPNGFYEFNIRQLQDAQRRLKK